MSNTNLSNPPSNALPISPSDGSSGSSAVADSSSSKSRPSPAATDDAVSLTAPSSHPASTDNPALDPFLASADTLPGSKNDDASDHHDSPPPLTADNSSSSPSDNDSSDKAEPGGFIVNGSDDRTLAPGAAELDPDTIGTDAELAASQTSDSHSQSSADGEGDWSSDGFEPDLRRVKVCPVISQEH